MSERPTCALHKSPGENALSAVEAAAAPARIDVLADQDVIPLLEGQVSVCVSGKVVERHHPLHASWRSLRSEQR